MPCGALLVGKALFGTVGLKSDVVGMATTVGPARAVMAELLEGDRAWAEAAVRKENFQMVALMIARINKTRKIA
jgi:hypothetical protein